MLTHRLEQSIFQPKFDDFRPVAFGKKFKFFNIFIERQVEIAEIRLKYRLYNRILFLCVHICKTYVFLLIILPFLAVLLCKRVHLLFLFFFVVLPQKYSQKKISHAKRNCYRFSVIIIQLRFFSLLLLPVIKSGKYTADMTFTFFFISMMTMIILFFF